MNILWLALILMFLVLVHEAGHMVVAKWCGMRVERFSIFFGRPIASFTRGETEYAIGWLPLGGYVKISGMTVGEDIPSEVAHRAYSAAPMWKKIATIAAGPAVNILLAIVIFAGDLLDRRAHVQPSPRASGASTRTRPPRRGPPAPGDRIVAVNGVQVNGDAADRARGAPVGHAEGQTVRLTVERDGRTLREDGAAPGAQGRRTATRSRTPRPAGPLTGLGFTFDAGAGARRCAPGPLEGLTDGWDFAWFIMKTNVEVIGDAFTSSEAREPDQLGRRRRAPSSTRSPTTA